MKSIFVLHEYGAPSHFTALVSLASQNGYKVRFGEFGIKRQIRFTRRRLLHNILFLLRLKFSSHEKVVLAIAPFNSELLKLMNLLKNHEVYYFTSYTCWDGSRYVYPPQSNNIRLKWNEFLDKYVKHVFVVSNKTKNEMIKNNITNQKRISIVNHSYKIKIAPPTKKRKTNSFIVVGELASRKGTLELIRIFSSLMNAEVSFVGRGVYQDAIIDASNQNKNIHYYGFVNGLNNIIKYYEENCFLILNSHRENGWEEFFGLALIEGMACGCVPIATDHSGPKEIITNGLDGLIYKEGSIIDGIKRCVEMGNEEYLEMRRNAIRTGALYYCEKKAANWSQILK